MGMSKNEIELLDTLRDKKRNLFLMTKMPGWRVFVEDFLKKSAQVAYQHAVGATTGTEMGKHLGAFNTLEQIESWPEREIERLTMQINAIELVER